jgi:hypothetical protein
VHYLMFYVVVNQHCIKYNLFVFFLLLEIEVVSNIVNFIYFLPMVGIVLIFVLKIIN